MNEMIAVKPLNVKEVAEKETSIKLVFHIPAHVKTTAEVVINLTGNEVGLNDSANIVSSPAQTNSILSNEPVDEIKPKAQTKAKDVEEVFPFFSLNIKNQAAVYKIGMSYVRDVLDGKKHFGFSQLAKKTDDLSLLVYGAFINYSTKKPVLIIVRDLSDKKFDKYRAHFNRGTLWSWNTVEWSNICFIDHKQLIKTADQLNKADLNMIMDEFAAVLWSLPEEVEKSELHRASLTILTKIRSVTFLLKKGETPNNKLKKATAYYKCFEIPIKGILMAGE